VDDPSWTRNVESRFTGRDYRPRSPEAFTALAREKRPLSLTIAAMAEPDGPALSLGCRPCRDADGR